MRPGANTDAERNMKITETHEKHDITLPHEPFPTNTTTMQVWARHLHGHS